MNVAVLGCGPAGLLVAHAVEQAGGKPHIISHKQKSVIPGSQYLHAAIPGVTHVYPENIVQYVRLGTARGYAEKVYGDPERNTGWENYNQAYPSWSVPRAYDVLWDRYQDDIDDRSFPHGGGEELREVLLGHDLTISTLPQWLLCYKIEDHVFQGEPYWIQTLPTPQADANKDIAVYNGLPHDHWYRWSILGGICSIESTTPIIGDHVISGNKANQNNCDCWPTMIRAGRWAEWRHGVLLHDAYWTAYHAVRGEA